MTLSDPTLAIVSTRERPDLVPVAARWRWEAFSRGTGVSFEDALLVEERGVEAPPPLPSVLVILDGDDPVGMAALAERDLDSRPDFGPWLAGVFVHPDHRGRGHAARLVRAVEALARTGGWTTLWLYTGTAEALYDRLGWATVERFVRAERELALMRRDLA